MTNRLEVSIWKSLPGFTLDVSWSAGDGVAGPGVQLCGGPLCQQHAVVGPRQDPDLACEGALVVRGKAEHKSATGGVGRTTDCGLKSLDSGELHRQCRGHIRSASHLP